MESIQTKLISEAVAEWTRYCKRRFCPNTQSAYKRIITSFAESLPDDVKFIDQLKRQHIENYIDLLFDNAHTARTCNLNLNTIKSFCRWLYEPSESTNPAAKIKRLKENPPKARFLSRVEYQKLLAVAKDGKEADVLRLLANLGLRASELIDLRWSNVKPDNSGIVFTGKGLKRRFVPCNSTVKNIFAKYPHDTEYILNFWQWGLYRNALYKLCRRLSEKAGISPCGPHSLRHLFCTELLAAGIPIIKVSRLMGHSSIKITESIYIHFLPEHLDNATEVLFV